jgi:hypothetical protein
MIDQLSLEGDREKVVWIRDASQIEAIVARPTRFGDRLLITMRGSHREYWVNDTPFNRSKLCLEPKT